MKRVFILGTRGLPAKHGGFETCVQELAPFLVEMGWDVTVYCQEESGAAAVWRSSYEGVNLIHIRIRQAGVLGTILFDLKCMLLAIRQRPSIILSFGYPTGVFAVLPRCLGIKHVINMDGIEWKRSQFGQVGRAAYYVNEYFASWFANHLVADHPCIASHLARHTRKSKITTIAYGARDSSHNSGEVLCKLGLVKDRFAILIARPEIDNSVLELITAFSARERGIKLVVLGKYSDENRYHMKCLSAASTEVVFLGAIYGPKQVMCLRKNACFYLHGHKVGGTNPSLVEALCAGRPIIAHDNPFNRWVAGGGALYAASQEQMDQAITSLLNESDLLEALGKRARDRFEESFQWPDILNDYNTLLHDQTD